MKSVSFMTVAPDGQVAETTVENPNSDRLLHAFYDAIQCDLVGSVKLRGRKAKLPALSMYIDDEGWIGGKFPVNKFATAVAYTLDSKVGQMFYGTAVFIGGLDSAGNDTSLPSEIAEHIRATVADCHRYFTS